jgi:purine nucleosidase/pyrimidine-specific ribonucleoside hydrolase
VGGAIDVPGNLGVLAAPPYSTNAIAAGDAGLRIRPTPLDATDQLGFTRDDRAAWLATGTPASILASEFLDFALTAIQSGNGPNPVSILLG